MMKKNKILEMSALFMLFSSFVGFILSMLMIFSGLSLFIEFELISLNSSSYMLIFYIDWMSSMFLFIVSTISCVVIFYSKSYMSGEIFINRFIILILLFVMSMILLIFSLNLISILLGWDGLGLVSYCLVIFYQNVKSFNSGMLTVLSNRIGDVMLLMSISWMINLGSWNFMMYMYLSELENYMYIILTMVVLAAMTKSAQIPFSAWLPAAMAAPTPVSSLVHSSTLVTAGVYLLIRFSEVLQVSGVGEFLLLMSSLTMLMAGLSANFEFDLKKIIALSTLSQLGLMMSILCLGFSNMAFFHLSTHAMFKALLFMCAGLVIHNLNNNQDIRFMGSLGFYMPLVSVNFNISNLALCGVPFMAGFYSKDLILEMVLFSNINMIIFFFFFFSTGLTVSYTVRLLYFSMMKEFSLNKIFSLLDKDLIMIKSMMILLFMSIFSGSLLNWLIMPFFYMIYLKMFFKLMVFNFISGGILVGLLISIMNFISKSILLNKFFFYLGNMWFISNISVYGVNMFVLNLSFNLDKILDLGSLEYLGGLNLYKKFMLFSKMNYYLYFNSIKLFIFFFFIFYLFMLLF
uniref:NADH dehydrogenase subunit 5 n=1 Tax=Hydropsyche fukienensis TaxID=3381246 RepID=UPI0022DCE12F|nr:NADH dehydrogenase subunit 5 [Ceratopsyche fukienensis]UZZ44033.1 NADH dehydrogenase subunit 5 [Ceratopsyche fukienensis]